MKIQRAKLWCPYGTGRCATEFYMETGSQLLEAQALLGPLPKTCRGRQGGGKIS